MPFVVKGFIVCAVNCRSTLTSQLADEVENLDATDIMVLDQQVLDVLGVTCVDVYVRVLAPSGKYYCYEPHTTLTL